MSIRAVMEDMDDDGYGDHMTYDSDDSRNDADLVSTRLHGIQLTEEGGDDDGENPADVCRNDTGFL